MKNALVISGGGSKGAFAVGVIKKLVEQYLLDFDVVVGTSTGALIAPLAALGRIDELQKLYTTTTNDQIIEKHNLGERLGANSIFTVKPLWDKISALYTDDFFDELNQSGKEIYITTTCLQTEEIVVFTNAANPAESKYYQVKKMHDGDHFRKAVMASACQPVFMTPVKVNKNVPGEKNPDHQFVDGGVREYAGVEMAINAAAKEIFTILLSAKNAPVNNTQYNTLFPILEQTIAIFTNDVGKNDLLIPFQYNEALKYIDAVKNKMKREGMSADEVNRLFTIRGKESPWEDKIPLKIHIIQPETPLGGGPGGLEFVPAEMKKMLAKGQVAVDEFVASLKPGEVDWA
ncbi:MAG: patatin-like phospholipase family protein [Ferruginibacter sp.]